MAIFGFGELIDKRFLFMNSIGNESAIKVAQVEDMQNAKIVALQYCGSTNPKIKRDFINSCQNIYNVHGKNVAEIIHMNLKYDYPYIVMPIYKNNLLDEMPNLRCNVEEIIRIFKEVCKGIKSIHNCGIIHGNITPANILITNENGVMISSVGVVASDINDNTLISNNSKKIGSNIYAAPEQKKVGSNHKVDERTDVYQLGKILYHMYTGEIPILVCKESIPSELWGIIDKATRTNIEERYETVGQLIDAITDCEGILHGEVNFKLIYDNLYTECIELLKVGRYNDDKLINLLQVVEENEDSYDIFFDFLEKVPNRLIAVICQRYSGQFENIISGYYEFIKLYAQGFSTDYVDKANKTFEVVFRYSEDMDTKIKALKCLVYLAVELKRYTSVESITRILNDVTDRDDAMTIVQGINEESEKFTEICNELPKENFKSPLRNFFMELSKDA